MAYSLDYLDNVPNAAVPENSILNSILEENFDHTHFKHTVQRNAIIKILKRESDVIVSLPKGHGRTTCFLLPIILCEKKVSIVVVGLPSRIDIQIDRLKNVDAHIDVIDNMTTAERWETIKNTIQWLFGISRTLNSILFVTPDVIATVDFLNFLTHFTNTNSIGYIVVDLSYCEQEWVSGEKKEFYALRSLRNTYTNIPWIVTTEKLRNQIGGSITNTLSLRTHKPGIPRNSIPWFSLNIEDDDEQVDR